MPDVEDDLELLPSDDDSIDFDRTVAKELYLAGFGEDPNMSARWARVTDPSVIEFVDVVRATHGEADSNGSISCPFHGRDSRPSFKLFRGSNDAYCFGCPEGEKYYCSVRFLVAKFGFTRLQAIAWLEREYDLPPLEIEEDEDEDSDIEVVSLNFHDLKGPYIELAANAFRATLNPELARSYMAVFFEGEPARKADPNSDEELAKIVPMARILGWKALEEIKKQRLR